MFCCRYCTGTIINYVDVTTSATATATATAITTAVDVDDNDDNDDNDNNVAVAVYVNIAVVAANDEVLLKRTRHAFLLVAVDFVNLFCERR